MNFKEASQDEAVAAGFAGFNANPHLCVEVPDGNYTITAKLSNGKRVTFAFQPYVKGGPADCVDVCFHDSGRTIKNGGRDCPQFDVMAFALGRTPYDSRKEEDSARTPTLVTVLL